jgi:adenylylsulfate kinase-like enzyme
LFAAAETVTVVASRCPEESVRSELRTTLGEYIEIYCADSSAEPPSDSPAAGFEVPSEPELIVQPRKQSTEDSARAVLTWLEDMGYLSPADNEAYSTEEQSTILKRLEELGYI